MIDALVEIFSRRTGISRRVTKGEVLDRAIDNTVMSVIAELKRAEEK